MQAVGCSWPFNKRMKAFRGSWNEESYSLSFILKHPSSRCEDNGVQGTKVKQAGQGRSTSIIKGRRKLLRMVWEKQSYRLWTDFKDRTNKQMIDWMWEKNKANDEPKALSEVLRAQLDAVQTAIESVEEFCNLFWMLASRVNCCFKGRTRQPYMWVWNSKI